MFKFYFDNTQVSDPINWDDFEETIERNADIKGLLPKYDIKLDFIGDAYDYLNTKKIEQGYCKFVEFRVDYKCGSTYKTILQGYIPISDCKFNLSKCLVSTQIVDNNFGARIYNNKNIKTELNTGKSKNGIDITAATEYSADFFKPSDGTTLPTKRKVVFVYDAFRYLIDFMTDGTVGFESDYLYYLTGSVSTEALAKTLTVVLGAELRTPSQSKTAYISFNDLFIEVNKKYPIAFTVITGTDGRPTIKIEEESYFYNAGSSLQINYVSDLSETFDNEILYSKVVFGGTTATYDNTIHSFGGAQFLGFKEEEYHLTGECNIDKALDLKCEYIIDTNIIEELVYTNTSNSSYDTETFLVECRYYDASTIQAIPYANLVTNAATPAFYNGGLANNKVAERYNLQGSIAQYLGGNDVGFMASTSPQYYFTAHTNAASSTPVAVQSTTAKAKFNNDSTPPNYDTAGCYDPVNNRYVSIQAGSYQFNAIYAIYKTTPSGEGVDLNRSYRVTMAFRRYNAANTLLEDNLYYFPSQTGFYSNTGIGYINMQQSHIMYLDATDYAEMWITIESQPYLYTLASNAQFFFNGIFSTQATVTGGGIYQESDPKDYFVSRFEFNRPLSNDEYELLKADLSKSILFNTDGTNNITGWIRKIDRNLTTGETKLELVSNLNNS